MGVGVVGRGGVWLRFWGMVVVVGRKGVEGEGMVGWGLLM